MLCVSNELGSLSLLSALEYANMRQGLPIKKMPDNHENTDPGHVTPKLIWNEVRSHRKDTAKQFAAVGERLVRVETKVDDMAPQLTEACQKANGAKLKLASMSARNKAWFYIAGIAVSGALGALIKWLVG